MPQASPVPCLDSVTRHLRAQQHRDPLSAATSPLGTPTLGTATGCQRREVPGTASRTLGLCSLLVTWGTSSPTPGPSQQRMELGTVEEEQALPAGALPAAETKSCSSPSLSLCTPSLPTRLDSSAGGLSLCSGVPPCPLPWTHSPGIPGNGLPSTAGALPAASMPWVMPSVRLGCEDEESVFLLADPLHELVDSIDGAGLGPQGTVAYVELKGIGYPRQEVLAGACEIDVLQGP